MVWEMLCMAVYAKCYTVGCNLNCDLEIQILLKYG